MVFLVVTGFLGVVVFLVVTGFFVVVTGPGPRPTEFLVFVSGTGT